jgi:hypothetical protein
MNGLKYGEHQLGNIWRHVLVWTHQLDNIWRWVRQVQLYGHCPFKTQDIEESKKSAYP